MGYRSEWQILAHGEEKQIKKFLKWMQEHPWKDALTADVFWTEKSLIEVILESERDSGSPMNLLFSDDSTKCYQPWESVVLQVLEYGREELKLDMAYGRLGEDIEDAEFDNGNDLAVQYTRSLLEPAFPVVSTRKVV